MDMIVVCAALHTRCKALVHLLFSLLAIPLEGCVPNSREMVATWEKNNQPMMMEEEEGSSVWFWCCDPRLLTTKSRKKDMRGNRLKTSEQIREKEEIDIQDECEFENK